MRVLVDATTWGNPRGFGRYTRSLVGRVIEIDGDNDYVLLFDRDAPDRAALPARARAVTAGAARSAGPVLAAGSARTPQDVWRMSAAAAREAPDVVFFPAVDTWFPVRSGVPTIVTVHDVIPEVHPELTVLSRRARALRRLKVWAALRRSTRIAAVSEHARREICRRHRVAPERTVVVPCGADDVFRPPVNRAAAQAAAERLGAPAPYLLYVGAPDRHKNFTALVSAFARVAGPSGSHTAELIVVGPNAPEDGQRALAVAAAHGVAGRVRHLGCPSDGELAVLYQGAEALVIPSFAEGFGLPAVEAVACGTPALVTRRSPLPEVLGDAAIALDPLSEDDIARALTLVLGDAGARARLRAAASALAGSGSSASRALSWTRGAEALREALADAVPRARVLA
jgi:glycosyltransferase involved in cell wall biosynthesis